MKIEDWQNTVIWRHLNTVENPLGKDVCHFLNSFMPTIQSVLHQGGTASLDFTLHDDAHSFRVAERMVKIIPEDVFKKLSPYEYAFLLLSAYLHDIGMTPAQEKVSAHYKYLMTGEEKCIASEDRIALQKWLDDYQGGMTVPVVDSATPESIDKVSFLTTHYSRYRHNDWSEDWINRNFPVSTKLKGYSGWREDLVSICRSHHYGYSELIKSKFDPRIVGDDVVHLRYLACVLRIADILEFDPERTPEVIFQHRNISEQSKIFWWKDHEISFLIDSWQPIVSARPSSALLHKAIEDTVDQIDVELRLCRQLADETHFDRCPGKTSLLPHRWSLLSTVHRSIKPRENTYEYIDGAFRPDTQKVLDILSGTALYGDRIVAIRELIQNAFDAIYEQIAYSRLEWRDPKDHEYELALKSQHFVNISVESINGETWLICSDSGVGMTKAIISNYLLRSGRGTRHETLDLARRCEAAGFNLGRTGQFGIGFLSYFMLAKRIIIETCRSQEAKDSEACGWIFETNGIGTFGELRKSKETKRGTTIRLLLHQEVIGKDIGAWIDRLRNYLELTLVRTPSNLSLTYIAGGAQRSVLNFRPGWVSDHERFSKDILKSTRYAMESRHEEQAPLDLLSSEVRLQREKEDQEISSILAEIKDAIRWKTLEGYLPDNLGLYRIHICYFEIQKEPSLLFLRMQDEAQKKVMTKVRKGLAVSASGGIKQAWKGFSVSVENEQYSALNRRYRGDASTTNSFYEIDIQSSRLGSISVDRKSVNFEADVAKSIFSFLETERKRLFFEVGMTKSVLFEATNLLVLKSKLVKNNIWWPQGSAENGIAWMPIKFPATSSLPFIYHALPEHGLKWQGKTIALLPCLGSHEDDDHYDGFAWHGDKNSPDKILYCGNYYDFKAIPIWEGIEGSNRICPLGLAAEFPPEWTNLTGIYFAAFSRSRDPRIVWNKGNHLVTLVTEGAWQWVKKTFDKSKDPLNHKDWIFQAKENAAAWMLLTMMNGFHEIWEGIIDRDQKFLRDLFEFLGLDFQRNRQKGMYYYIQDTTGSRLRILNENSWSAERDKKSIELILSVPEEKWLASTTVIPPKALTKRKSKAGSRARKVSTRSKVVKKSPRKK